MGVVIVPVTAQGWKGVKSPGVTIYPAMFPLHQCLSFPFAPQPPPAGECGSYLLGLFQDVVIMSTGSQAWN